MADKKITELAAIAGSATDVADLLAIVDVSDNTMAASGTDKKITRAELLNALASAFAQTVLDDGDQPTARTTLGVGTGDSPQFAGLNVGAATDTTITRTGAGDIAVEGNAIYRAGGTDVPVADGGTGASNAAAGLVNLNGVPLTVVHAAGDIIIATASATMTAVTIGAANQVPSVSGTSLVYVDVYSLPQKIRASTNTFYVLAVSDAGKLITNTNTVLVKVDLNVNVALPVGTNIDLATVGDGKVTVTATAGVTINAAPGQSLRTKNSGATIVQTDTNTWMLFGDLST